MSTLAGFSVEAPSAPVSTPHTSSGGLDHEEDYGYAITYVTAFGETLPSGTETVTTTTSGSVLVTLPAAPGTKNITHVRIYRTEGGASDLKLLTELPVGVKTYIDTTADEDLSDVVAPEIDTSSPNLLVRGSLIVSGGVRSDYDYGITATPEGTKTTAYLLRSGMSVVTVCATGGDAVRLPALTEKLDGVVYTVVNKGSEELDVLASGADLIDGIEKFSIESGAKAEFLAVGADWIVL